MDLSNRLFEQFSDLVYKQSGINLHDGKKALLQARLNKRIRATGIESYEDYYRHLTSESDPQELIQFLDCISTNLTYFFREPQHFEFLEAILPTLLEAKKKKGDKRLRAWSAGCSTGEEPYSLAMCILGHLGDSQKWDFRILATDISTKVLSIATKGVYAEDKVQKVAPALRNMYFRKVGDKSKSEFEVSQQLKSIMTFRRLNLKETYPFKGPFDFIFCRNVMIYFDKPTQEDLIQKMSKYLSADGYLFVGHSESLMGLKHSLSYVRPAVYRT